MWRRRRIVVLLLVSIVTVFTLFTLSYHDSWESYETLALNYSSSSPSVVRHLNDTVNVNKSFPSKQLVIPVLLIACNRPKYVEKTLKSLTTRRRSYGGDAQFPIYVSLGCSHVPTKRQVVMWRKEIYDIFEAPSMDHLLTTYHKIAAHYKFALDTIFAERQSFDQVVIVEDDMEFGADFFHYFASLAHMLVADESLFCVSAWNDNGRPGLIDESETGARLLHRTDFFPGLGWMLTRTLYMTELQPVWPNGYWDDWMRLPEQRKGRACIRPEMSRTHNFGKIGTSYGQFFSRYIAPVVLQTSYDRVDFDLQLLAKDVYDDHMDAEIASIRANDRLVLSLGHLKRLLNEDNSSLPVGLQYSQRQFKDIANHFSLMDDEKSGIRRTEYRKTVPIYNSGRRIYLIENTVGQAE